MNKYKFRIKRKYLTAGILLIAFGLFFPVLTRVFWFDIIYKIKSAILLGDSGYLILASALMSFLYGVQGTFLFLGAVLSIHEIFINYRLSNIKISFISFTVIIVFNFISSLLLDFPFEISSTVLSLFISLYIFKKLFKETNSFFQVCIVSFQVYFAFQWINIMPVFSSYYMGQSDIPCSIKIAGLYLNAESVLNFIGFAFFLPFIFSAFLTSALFISFSRNINIMKENYEKEKEIQDMKSKILQGRINNEVKSLVHDLKTPLVTIRGLSTLLSISNDCIKIKEYSEKIESSVDKMNEMISCFLYEKSRHRIKTSDLINYVRAQLPVDDNSIRIDINISENLPDIYVNKIRMARAVMNILENAIIVPHKNKYKHIIFEVVPFGNGINIIVKDNGIGINESDIHRIFEMGYSTNNTSGLGLWLAKQVIEENDGRIEVASKEGEGTTVTIYLPEISNV